MEKPSKGILKIPGTILNSQSAQLLTSTGIHSLDSILGKKNFEVMCPCF